MVKVNIRCGEVYDFNVINSITDNGNGTVEIYGNFKPKGKHKYVILWKQSIVNWDELKNIFEIAQKPYFCTNCKRVHHSGNVYDEHKEFYGKKDDLIPTDRIIKANLNKLPERAIRQIKRLIHRMKLNPGKIDVYRKEINRVILYEGASLEEIFPRE